MNIIQELKNLKPDEQDSEIAKDVAEIRRAQPGITDEQIFEQAKQLVQGLGKSPQPVTEKNAMMAALQGLAGMGDAISGSYGNQKTDYLNKAIFMEQQEKENEQKRQKAGVEKTKLIADIRKEFTNRPEVREYVTISTQVRAMDSLLDNAKSGNMDSALALDQALITIYNKLTDPNSVVRESEYARTPENLPTVHRIQGAIRKIAEGGAGLTPKDREALVLGAKIIANERGKELNRNKEFYMGEAKAAGLDPSRVAGSLKEFQAFNVTGGKIKVSNGKETFYIDPKDRAQAEKDGFRVIK